MNVIRFMTQNVRVTYRPLTSADAETWARLKVLSLAERELDASDTCDGVLLAFVGSDAVGFVQFVIQHSDCTWERAYLIQDLHLIAAHADSGIGAELIRAVYEAALSTGFPAVYWHSALNALQTRPARPTRSFVQKVA